MYQIFIIKLKRKEISLQEKLGEVNKLNWYFDGRNLTKFDDDLQYVFGLSHFNIKCFVGELFPIEEGEWLPEDYPGREEIVKSLTSELRKLPFDLEIDEIKRIVKHEGYIRY